MVVISIVLGAGRGRRLGGSVPKALLPIAGKTMLHWSAAALARAQPVNGVLVVIPPGHEASFGELARAWQGPARLVGFATGGDTRQASLGCGLARLSREQTDPDWVLIHDAARCFVEPGDAEAVLAAASATGAAIPVVPVSETVKRISGEEVLHTEDRRELVLAQTPQAFRTALLREALEKALRDDFEGTDCASLVERLGVRVRTVPGRIANWKLTEPSDLERAQRLLGEERRP